MANIWMSYFSCLTTSLLICHVWSTEQPPSKETNLGDKSLPENPTEEIPLDLWVNVVNSASTKEFIQKYVDFTKFEGPLDPVEVGGKDVNQDTKGLELPFFFRAPRPDSRIIGRSDAISSRVPNHAGCIPRLAPVQIPNSEEAGLLLWPTCTLVERCGGCCSHPLLHCVPIVKDTITKQIMKARYNKDAVNKFIFEGVVSIPLERHNSCMCACRISPSQCNAYQEYRDCKCHCLTEPDFRICEGNQVWSDSECRCVCPDYPHCTKGKFGFRTCSCVDSLEPAFRPTRPPTL